MKVGILGSGVVGQVLANGFIKHGHDVMIGTRTSAKLDEWQKKAGAKGKTGSFSEAAAFGEIAVLAAKGTAAQAVLELAGAEHLAGKTVIDTSNPIADLPPNNGVLHYFTSFDLSLMEQLQAAYPKANFVKAFSCIGNALMVNPDFDGVKPTMFICGNSVKGKQDVSELLDVFGFEVEDMGGAEAARAIEPLAMLWCIPGFQKNEWRHAFKLLRKSSE